MAASGSRIGFDRSHRDLLAFDDGQALLSILPRSRGRPILTQVISEQFSRLFVAASPTDPTQAPRAKKFAWSMRPFELRIRI